MLEGWLSNFNMICYPSALPLFFVFIMPHMQQWLLTQRAPCLLSLINHCLVFTFLLNRKFSTEAADTEVFGYCKKSWSLPNYEQSKFRNYWKKITNPKKRFFCKTCLACTLGRQKIFKPPAKSDLHKLFFF